LQVIRRLCTVFRISAAGKLTSLYSFCAKTNCSDGASPQAGLLLANNGNLYGTTSSGGNVVSPYCFPTGCGTIFEITPLGKLTTLYTFCSQTKCADGADPYAGLTQGTDGSFYGTTSRGGAGSKCSFAGVCGVVFRITPAGELTTLYSFCSQMNCTDGFDPSAGLIQAADGDFYGTTFSGGQIACYSPSGGGCGTVFKISAAGELTTLYTFCSLSGCADGINPQAGLIEAADGNFYGTTTDGGTYVCEGDDETVGCGTIFEITTAGVFTVLQRLDGTDGYVPSALIQATDLNLYGTTNLGGSSSLCGYPFDTGCGTVFKITADNKLITLHNFCVQTSCTDGASPQAALLQSTNGDLYGTTSSTVFRLSGGLPPFVALVQSAGRVGQRGGILGQGFNGTNGVFLNGTPATFTVVSDTYIQATVPVGASSGFVTVSTPSAMLTSNVPFHVIP
jgi:uncharacterized repeat protein (TIGR03803 family)